MVSEVKTFHPADYGVFGAVLAISAGIGVFHALTGGRQRTTSEFLMANRDMRYLPVALSVLASFFSASTLLGTPAEIYQYGTQYWISVFGAVLAPITGALLFGPLFFRLKLVSVFEYLELRFRSRTVRLFGALIFLIRATLGMGIVLYGPSTALNAVTQFPVWGIILMLGGVCTFYTTLGGMKAVIWTDVFQTIVMLAGMLAVFIQGCIKVGGLSRMWELADMGGRIEFLNFDIDPHVRSTFWSLIIGIYFVWLPPYTVDQQMVQRFSSTKSLKEAKIALLLNVPGMFILITLCSIAGLALYANYANCDPLLNNDIRNPNQLLPHFVMEIFGDLPGLPGLFVACLFSGGLSSVSSMLNSLSAVTWEDFLKPKFKNTSDQKATWYIKLLAVIFGLLGIGMAFIVERMGGTVLQGALTGGIMGFAFPMWIGIGQYVNKPLDFKLPTTIEGCNITNMTMSISTTTAQLPSQTLTPMTTGLNKLYGLSYLWFSAIGILLSVVLGLLYKQKVMEENLAKEGNGKAVVIHNEYNDTRDTINLYERTQQMVEPTDKQHTAETTTDSQQKDRTDNV
ncbi:hypothetical protein KUTeg_023452 [Tegillarca granosa]|uniref:Sodium-coupled monocarboxylate transporter 1 n=1 Tax=Tegillarca granosa TaxID=220873 RepID=A0ABQ9E285_TEGGR|nr:hypothetical protein KUTeg_023452 [Tegillarca granosa]